MPRSSIQPNRAQTRTTVGRLGGLSATERRCLRRGCRGRSKAHIVTGPSGSRSQCGRSRSATAGPGDPAQAVPGRRRRSGARGALRAGSGRHPRRSVAGRPALRLRRLRPDTERPRRAPGPAGRLRPRRVRGANRRPEPAASTRRRCWSATGRCSSTTRSRSSCRLGGDDLQPRRARPLQYPAPRRRDADRGRRAGRRGAETGPRLPPRAALSETGRRQAPATTWTSAAATTPRRGGAARPRGLRRPHLRQGAARRGRGPLASSTGSSSTTTTAPCLGSSSARATGR